VTQLSEESYINEYSHLISMYLRSHNYTIDELVALHSEPRKNDRRDDYEGYYNEGDRYNDDRYRRDADNTPASSSYLTKPQFATMSQLFLPKDMLKSEVITKIFREIDENNDNYVSVGEFEYLFDREVKNTFNQNLGRLRLDLLEDLSKRRVGVREFFEEIASKNKNRSRSNLQHLKKKLGAYWVHEDLSRCLMFYEIEVGPEEEANMYKLMDANGDDVIGIDEFFTAILGKKTNAKQLSKSLRRVLRKEKIDVKKIARRIDVDGNK
jgi:Ca2+-binding EF-hand superfamily protein